MLVHTYQLHLDPTKDLVDLFARFPSPPPAQFLCCTPISSVTLHQWQEGLGKHVLELDT